MNECDVAIVGAGPAGSSTAITLAQKGYHVALIDRARFPREKLCGDFVNPINWPVLDQLAVSQDVLARPHNKISSFRITAADGAEAFSAIPVQGERGFGLGLRRFHLDHVLLQRAKRAGVSVNEGVKVTGVERNSSGWRLDMDRHGERFSTRAKVLVGADGRNSLVACQLGVALERPKPSSSVGFEIQLRKCFAVRASVEIHQFGGGYAGLARIDESTIKLGFAVQRSLLGRSVSFESLRERFLCRNPFLDKLLCVSEPASDLRSAWPVYFVPRKCFGAGFLLVGDAARVTEPVTGEGIFFALRSGQLAATAIAAALRVGDESLARFSQYDRACRAEFGARLRLNSLIRVLMYRPKLLSLAIELLGKRKQLMESLINAVCLPRTSFGSEVTLPHKAGTQL
jgi:geranylgeranyl reductase family protein